MNKRKRQAEFGRVGVERAGAHQLRRGIQADSRASIADTTGIAAIVLARPKERLECRPQASVARRLRQDRRNMGLRSKASVAEWFKAAVLFNASGVAPSPRRPAMRAQAKLTRQWRQA